MLTRASLRLRRRTGTCVELVNGNATRWLGALVAAITLLVTIALLASRDTLPGARPLALVAGVTALFGLLLATEHRRFVFDRQDGVLRRESSILGFAHKETVPLFHLRDIVLNATTGHFVMYLRRRVGETILLGEADTCAGLLRAAEAIAEIAEIRLEYDATARHAR